MLTQRILTAFVLVPLVLLIIFYSSSPAFCIITGLITLAAAWEWSHLMGLKQMRARSFYLLLTAVVLTGALFISVTIIFAGAFIWWLLALLLMVRYPQGREWWAKGVTVRGFMGFFVLLPCWAALNYIRNQGDGAYALLFLFFLIWGADTFAYFAGKKWGKTKLAPQISPGKTWAGLSAALLGSSFIALITLWLCNISYSLWPWAVLLSLVTVIFSVAGDLFESMMKREAGVKDSGKLLPGHGGLLDRIDSLTAAAPIFVLGGLLLGKVLS